MAIIILNGTEYDAEAVTNLMDSEIRERLHFMGFDTEQEFLDAYLVAHADKFDGEEFLFS